MGGVHVGSSHPPPPSHRRPPCPACARRVKEAGQRAEDPPDTIPCGPSSSKAFEYMAPAGSSISSFCRGLTASLPRGGKAFSREHRELLFIPSRRRQTNLHGTPNFSLTIHQVAIQVSHGTGREKTLVNKPPEPSRSEVGKRCHPAVVCSTIRNGPLAGLLGCVRVACVAFLYASGYGRKGAL